MGRHRCRRLGLKRGRHSARDRKGRLIVGWHGHLPPDPAPREVVAQVVDAPGFETGTAHPALSFEDHVLGEPDLHQSTIADGGGL
jgi:hypothetical protein